MKRYDVIIVGGGLAGLTAALHLARAGLEVLVLEKHRYPRHKVCGEYLSNEVRPYLESLGVPLEQAIEINTLQLSTTEGKTMTCPLPLGGMGISRYALDALLYRQVLKAGVAVVFGSVRDIVREPEGFKVVTAPETFRARMVIGAYGKRAGLDTGLGRPFMKKEAPWLAVKAHYRHPSWPENLVGLHAFRGGYAGISQTESGALNFCYLASYRSFKPYGNIQAFTTRVLAQNPHLNHFLCESELLFKAPLTIAQIAFQKKEAVVNGVLMCGDTAGLIHPLCGNGMAMAVHSAKLASEAILVNLLKASLDREALARDYRLAWKAAFSRRLVVGRSLQKALLIEPLASGLLGGLAHAPWLLSPLIRATHGKPLRP